MAVFTVLSTEEARTIAGEFGLQLLSFQPLEGGSENTNYFLQTTEGDFVLTICESKSQKEAERLVEILNHLQQHGFATTTCLPTSFGQATGTFKNKPVLMKSFIQGNVYINLSAKQLFQAGKVLSQLHQVPVAHALPDTIGYGMDLFLPLADDLAPHLFSDWLRQTYNYLQAQIDPNLPRCFIHADLFNDNLVYQDEHAVILDFEEAAHYYRAFDIGMALVGTCRENNQLQMPSVRSFLDGYQQVEPLSIQEKNQLPVFITYAAAAMAMWRFRQFNYVNPIEAMRDRYKELQLLSDATRKLESSDLFPNLS